MVVSFFGFTSYGCSAHSHSSFWPPPLLANWSDLEERSQGVAATNFAPDWVLFPVFLLSVARRKLLDRVQLQKRSLGLWKIDFVYGLEKALCSDVFRFCVCMHFLYVVSYLCLCVVVCVLFCNVSVCFVFVLSLFCMFLKLVCIRVTRSPGSSPDAHLSPTLDPSCSGNRQN